MLGGAIVTAGEEQTHFHRNRRIATVSSDAKYATSADDDDANYITKVQLC